METNYTGFYSSTVGLFYITCNRTSVIWAGFRDVSPSPSLLTVGDDVPEVLKHALSQIAEYFQGTRRLFDLPLEPFGTPFQCKVWQELLQIPYGETCSYGALAMRIGNAKASRAVGMANNRNPISIIIPCHRVIGANGKLVGYGGGLHRKQWLLSLEKTTLI